MFLSQFPLSLPQTFACILCLYITHFTYRQLTTGARLRRFAAGKGCLPVKRIKVKDPFFGLDFLWTVYKAAKDHKLLELSQKHFADTGANTVGLKLLHDR